jgi:hypothetical protein
MLPPLAPLVPDPLLDHYLGVALVPAPSQRPLPGLRAVLSRLVPPCLPPWPGPLGPTPRPVLVAA